MDGTTEARTLATAEPADPVLFRAHDRGMKFAGNLLAGSIVCAIIGVLLGSAIVGNFPRWPMVELVAALGAVLPFIGAVAQRLRRDAPPRWIEAETTRRAVRVLPSRGAELLLDASTVDRVEITRTNEQPGVRLEHQGREVIRLPMPDPDAATRVASGVRAALGLPD